MNRVLSVYVLRGDIEIHGGSPMRRFMIVTAAAAVLGVTACGGGDDPQNVTREQFDAEGLAWPLTADEARIDCGASAHRVRVDGDVYALTGGDPDWDVMDADAELWADDPETEGLKVDLGDLQAYAAEVCG